jgi:putative ABC transport system permease protein
MLTTYLKIAWRNAVANKSYALISLGSLVLGTTLFFFISLWVKNEMSYDKSVPDADRICRVETDLQMQDGSTSTFPGVGWPVGKVLASNYPQIEKVTYVRDWHPIVSLKGTHFYEDALMGDEQFFQLFPYQFSEGNAATALSEPFNVVITESLKRKYFGDAQNVVGELLMLSDTVPYTIAGVLKESTAPSHLKFDMISSLSTYCAGNTEECEKEYASGWFDLNMYNYVKLKPNVPVATAEANIKSLVAEKGREAVAQTGFKPTLRLRPLTDIYLHSGMATAQGPTGNSKTVRLFFLIGVFILLIACLNFINLTTAKSLERAKEIGIKKVLGSDRRRLVLQFLTETAILCLIAAIISGFLMALLLPTFNQFADNTFAIKDLFSVSNILLLLLIVALLIPVAGFYPAWVLFSFKPIVVLKGKFSHSASGVLLRKGLVILQFVISIAFITGTLVIWQQMQYMRSRHLGFDKEKVVVVDVQKVPWVLRHNNAELFKNTLLGQTGIQRVTSATAVPGHTGWGGQFAWAEGKPKEAQLVVEYIPVDDAYTRTLGLQFVAGRDFRAGSNVDSTESLIINEAAVQLFGWQNAANAIGKKLTTSGKDGRVIGVLKDYHQHGLQAKINPLVLGMDQYISVFALRYDGISPKAVINAVQTAWSKAFGGYPVDYSFMDEDFQRQYQKEEKFGRLFGLAAGLSVLIACLGLFGLAIYTAQKRVKEIGIRKVLGASATGIAALLSKDFLKLVAVAVVIAAPLAWWTMNKWLESFAYRVSIGWWVFVAAGLLTVLIALMTVSFQAIRVAISNPVKSLRTE